MQPVKNTEGLMNNNNWPQFVALITAALFGVKPDELNVLHVSIIFASIVGAMWAISRNRQKTVMRGMVFFLRIALTAAVLASALSRLIAGFLPEHVSGEAIMPIIAFFIGLIGDDWSKAYRWGTSFFRNKVEEKSRNE